MSPRLPTKPSTRARARRRLLAILGIAVASSAMTPAFAAAGEYEVLSCTTPSGRAVPLDGASWSALQGGFVVDQCGTPGGSGLELHLGPDRRQANDNLTAFLRAPSGTTIQRFRAQRWLFRQPGSGPDVGGAAPGYGAFRDEPSWDGAHVLEWCHPSNGCETLGHGGDSALDLQLGGASSVVFQVLCGGPAGSWCERNDTGRLALRLQHLRTTLRDDQAPHGSATGTALGDAVLRGPESVRVIAQDAGGGARFARVLVDGVVRVESRLGDQVCAGNGETTGTDRSYDRLRPCPLSTTVDLSLDTTGVADGQRTLTVQVEDAAGNRATVAERRVAIDNVPPPAASAPPALSGATVASGLRPGDVVTSTDGSWSGADLTFSRQWQRAAAGESRWVDIADAAGRSYTVEPGDVGARLRVVVAARNAEGTGESASAATGVVVSGATAEVSSLPQRTPAPTPPAGPAPVLAPQAADEPGSPALVLDREQRSIRVGYRASILVTGRLVDATTLPIGSADVDVFEQLSVVGAPWRKIATVKTDAQGGYAFRPDTTGGRRLRFAFAADRSDGQYRAVREVTLEVRARMTARAERSVVRSRGLISLKGRVTVRPFPKAGASVDIQVRDGKTWRTIGTRTTSKRGLWTWRHRLTQARGVTYRFRARLRPSGSVPAVESRSRSLKVRVR